MEQGNAANVNEVNDDNETEVCEDCGSAPCEWREWGRDVLSIADKRFTWSSDGTILVDEGGTETPCSIVRKNFYQLFTYLKYGHLGRGVRIPIPRCVEQEIRRRYPEPDGNYLGFLND